MRRGLLIALLGMGMLLGFGWGFHSLRYHHDFRGRWHGHEVSARQEAPPEYRPPAAPAVHYHYGPPPAQSVVVRPAEADCACPAPARVTPPAEAPAKR